MNLQAEWLEVDGLGGYATGTVGGTRTRRYHALLCAALTPPTGRAVLVNGFDAFVETGEGRYAISSQKYVPDVVAPDGATRLLSFTAEPWPTWTWRIEDGSEIVQELCAVHGSPIVVVTWRLAKRGGGRKRGAKPLPVSLTLRPFLSGRDHHALHHANPAFRFEPTVARFVTKGTRAPESRLAFQSYDGMPTVAFVANGSWLPAPHWYERFHYDEDAARGFEASEDLASPGELTFDLARGEAVWILGVGADLLEERGSAIALADRLRGAEAKRRAAFRSPLERAADSFLVKRGEGATVIAGYPWFADWGRDTFIGVRGLCLATGRLAEARSILLEWAGAMFEGMLPNRFSEHDVTPEYNAVDASLWFVVAVEELLAAARRSRKRVLTSAQEKKLLAAVRSILEAFVAGTRFRIKIDDDELLAAGEPGQQLTWMDARVDGREVTPRIGKPVEIQALWHSALSFGGIALKDGASWKSRAADVHDSFAERFWNERDQCLYDVVDVDHVKGTVDASFRPNQILAIGGLPRPLLVGPRARKVVDAVESRLVTPLGVRTLAPEDSRYRPRYEGGPFSRDSAYHQGTAWPWLLGPFIDAWNRVRGNSVAARRESRRRFVQPLLDRMAETGILHLPELADAELPQGARGCPFQAWSLSELLRVSNGATLAARAG